MSLRLGVASLLMTLTPAWATGAEQTCSTDWGRGGGAGISAIWALANVSYAGMRAQNNPSRGWRVVSFILGFPGTLVTYFAVQEGSERAYGIDLPKKPSTPA